MQLHIILEDVPRDVIGMSAELTHPDGQIELEAAAVSTSVLSSNTIHIVFDQCFFYGHAEDSLVDLLNNSSNMIILLSLKEETYRILSKHEWEYYNESHFLQYEAYFYDEDNIIILPPEKFPVYFTLMVTHKLD